MIRSFTVKSDNLEVRAIAKSDERIMAADGMTTTRHHSKTQLLVVFGRLWQIFNDDHQVINTFKHRVNPTKTIIEMRARLL